MADAAPVRRGRRKTTAPEQGKSLLSSAALLTAGTMRARQTAPTEKQELAWSMFDAVGPLAFVTGWYAHAMERVEIYPVRWQGAGDPQRSEDPTAVAILDAFGGGPSGRSAALGQMAPHLYVPGECKLVGRMVEGGGGAQVWRVCSSSEVTNAGGQWLYDDGSGQVERWAEDDTMVVRVWNPHPRRRWQADSPVMHVLDDLAEYVGYSRRTQAEINSRLSGNGVLFIPREVDLERPSDCPAEVDPLTWMLFKTAEVAVANPASPGATIPLVMRAPGEYLDKIHWQQFWSEYDKELPELRDGAVKRLAQGLDIPPEILLGLSDSNHWTAWQVDEQSVKMHIDPMAKNICDALTLGYFRPMLRAAGVAAADSYGIGFDSTALKVKPDRTGDSRELYGMNLLSGRVVLAEHGYDPEKDKATQEDFDRIAALAAAEHTRPGAGTEPAVDVPAPPAEPVDDPAALPDGPPLQASAVFDLLTSAEQIITAAHTRELTTACDGLVVHALEMIGKKLRAGRANRSASAADAATAWAKVAIYDTHTVADTIPNTDRLFDGLWHGSERVAARFDLIPASLSSSLDGYVRELVANREAHTIERMRAAVDVVTTSGAAITLAAG